MKQYLITLMATCFVIATGVVQQGIAAPGGGSAKAELTTNIHVVDSASPPVIVGEVVSATSAGVVVAISPSLVNADPPFLLVLPPCNPASNPCIPI